MFNLIADGSNWHIAMNANNAKCLDLVGGGSSLGNGTQLADQRLPGGERQPGLEHHARPATGAFVFKNVQSGRCLDEMPNSTTASGTPMQIWDCSGPASQKISSRPTR